VIELDITPDEAFKLVMSAGVIQPGGKTRGGQPVEVAARREAIT